VRGGVAALATFKAPARDLGSGGIYDGAVFMKFRTLVSAALMLVGSTIVASDIASAQTYPSRPIRLLVGVPPGGATDLVARTVGHPLGQRLGQTVVVDNRPGANGNVAVEILAKAQPNGYTLIHANDSWLTINPHIYSNLPFDTFKDLVPIASVVTNQLVLAVNPSSVPVKDVKGFLEFARQAKPRLFYASIGNGSQHHLGMEILKQMTGIEMTHVPYRGGGPAAIAVIAGENAAMFGGGSVVPHMRSGKLRGLAVSGNKGWATEPELPSIGEQVPGFYLTIWQGMFAPRGTPQPIIERLRTEIAAVLAQPAVAKSLIETGSGEPYNSTPDEFAKLIRADYERYGKVVKSIGLKVD
jgi:tripartite-type tricarboxylate transporter receptor subunit TctC